MWLKLLCFLLLTLSCCIQAKVLKVAVATNFKPVLSQLAAKYFQQAGVQLKLSAASTGVLYTQIRHGAPFDVFLAADALRPQQLEQQGLIVEGSRDAYALGQLVLWYRDKSSQPIDGEFLTSWSVLKQGRLAIANPKLAPYGAAAQAVLERLKLWPYSALVRGNSVAQSFQFLLSNNAKLGFVAHSQVLAHGVDAKRYWLVPQHYYPEIEQQLVVLKASKRQPLALVFVDWLLSDDVQQLLVALGYGKASGAGIKL